MKPHRYQFGDNLEQEAKATQTATFWILLALLCPAAGTLAYHFW